MREEMEEICRRLQDSDQRYFGLRPAEELQRRLQAPGLDGATELELRRRLGRELIELGKPLEAVEELETALALAQKTNAPREARLDLVALTGLAHLQAAEDVNCIGHHTSASCILPVLPEGVHPLPDHARRAGDYFQAFLQEVPRSVQTAWLLNLSRMVSGDFPQGVPEPYRLSESTFAKAQLPGEPGRWVDRGPELGINALDLAGGAVMEDLDGDGLLDLVTSTSDPCDHLKAFRNDGHGGFEDVTRAWGLDEQLGGLNLVQADYDGDGAVDLLVLRGAWLFEQGRIRNSLLRNRVQETGRFEDVTRSAGLAEPAVPTQTAAWADYDGDGDLDLYVGNEALEPNLYPSRLWRNDGASFTDVTEAAGVANRRFAKGVTWGDYDDDGDPDLYVSNFGPNRLYENRGDGTFEDVAAAAGVLQPEGNSFASWFFDYDNDGDLDLLVADYNGPGIKVAAHFFGVPVPDGQPLLYRNDGGRFTEVSRSVGIEQPMLPMGSNYGDVDNDGWLDFYIGTGDPEFESQFPNILLRNTGGRFEDVTYSGGFGHVQKGHSVAFGDVDNDGDQDLFEQLGGFYPGDAFGNALFENPGGEGLDSTGHWITLRFEGKKANRHAVGARVEARVRNQDGSVRSVHALVGTGGSFGGNSLQLELGLGAEAVAVDRLIVRWPGSGTVQELAVPALDRFYRLVEGEELEALEVPRISLGG
ncbi:MAG: CRTAC1 family protein [Acidobacteriota bacterium]|nr:CRTAC1 family protein [Acidobacteriota bacterium]